MFFIAILITPFIIKRLTSSISPTIEVHLSDAPNFGASLPEPPPIHKSKAVESSQSPDIDYTKIRLHVKNDTNTTAISEISKEKLGTGERNTSTGTGANSSESIEILPSFPGGIDRMNEFIRINISYPRSEQLAHKEGIVEVGFIVKANGELTDYHIIKGVTTALDEEAMRVLKLMPEWNPGLQHNKVVNNVPVKISITFKL